MLKRKRRKKIIKNIKSSTVLACLSTKREKKKHLKCFVWEKEFFSNISTTHEVGAEREIRMQERQFQQATERNNLLGQSQYLSLRQSVKW